MNELKGEYVLDFYDVKEYVESHAKVGEKRNEALETLHAIYLEAQENGTPVSEIHEGTAKEYAKEIVEGLPHTSSEKKRKIKIAFAVLAFIAFALLAFFTGDIWNMYKGGYNYYEEFRERFYGAPIYFMEDVNVEYYKGKQDPNLASLGIYFESVYISENHPERIDVVMRSTTFMIEPGRCLLFTPISSGNLGQYCRFYNANDITAEINGVFYEGRIEFTDSTGKDLRYGLVFETTENNEKISAVQKSFESGEPINFYFENVDYISWSLKKKTELMVEGIFPFFVNYKVDPAEEQIEISTDYMKIYQLGNYHVGAVVYFEINEETGEYELAERSIPRKMSVAVENVKSGVPYIDEEGMLCVEVSYDKADGTKVTEILKTAIDEK